MKSATSIWLWRFARPEARVDSTRAATEALWARACSPCQRADWYAAHAVATAATASRTAARELEAVVVHQAATGTPRASHGSGVRRPSASRASAASSSVRSIATGRICPGPDR